MEHFKTESEDLFILFQNRNLDAITSAVKGSIDSLRKRVTTRYYIMYNTLLDIYGTVYLYHYIINILFCSALKGIDTSRMVPCFSADIVLSIPNIVCT